MTKASVLGGSQQLSTVDYGYNGGGDTKTRHATYTNGTASTSINETEFPGQSRPFPLGKFRGHPSQLTSSQDIQPNYNG
jgi:hypothetical protein